MGQGVLIVLVRIAQRQRVEVLTQQFHLEVADAVRTPVVRQLRGQIGCQSQAMIGLTQQQRPSVGRDSRIGLPQLDRAVKRRLKQPSVAFTHEVHLPFRGSARLYPLSTRRNGPGLNENS